jgi:hypothetical protein
LSDATTTFVDYTFNSGFFASETTSTTSPLSFVINYSSKISESESMSNVNSEQEQSSFNPSLIGAIVGSVLVVIIASVIFLTRQQRNSHSDEESEPEPCSDTPDYLEPFVIDKRDIFSNPIYCDVEEYPPVYEEGDSMPHYEVPIKNVKIEKQPVYDVGTMNNQPDYELASETIENEALYDLATSS